jgi:hypothetical protein
MTLVVDKFRTLLPPRAKSSPSGWTSFNAPCCQHRGHSPDTRKRGGIRFDGNGVVYNCFNCKFSTGWQPGSLIGEKMKTLSRWLGASEDIIKELVFEALKTESDEYQPEQSQPNIEFTDKELPEGAMPLLEWVNSKYWKDISLEVELVIAYVVSRGYDPFDGNFYWSPVSGYESRVIIPFKYNGNVVGNTARKVTNGKPKYLSDQHPHFVFNFDCQKENQKYIFVCEGPFDALSIDGVALLTNDIADQQARIINSLGAEVIVVPDQDEAGLQLIKKAIHYNWSVAFPNWNDDVKDCSDAVLRYGKLFTIVDIIKSTVSGEIKITMAQKALENRLKRYEYEKNN